MAILAQLLDSVIIHKFELTKPQIIIGRHASCDIVINDTAVSSRHARLTVKPNDDFPHYSETFIEDLDSTNGTFINDKKLVAPKLLHHDDNVRVAWNHFIYISEQPDQDLSGTAHIIKKPG